MLHNRQEVVHRCTLHWDSPRLFVQLYRGIYQLSRLNDSTCYISTCRIERHPQPESFSFLSDNENDEFLQHTY